MALDVEGKAERLPDGTKRLIGPKAPTLSEMAAELELWGLGAVLHTPHTHEEPAADGETLGPRFRVVLNASRPILPHEIKPGGLAVAAMLGLSDCTDTKCLEPARLFFLPRCPEERAHLQQSAVLDGEVLDVDALLSQAKRSAEPPPRKPGPAGASVIATFNAQADIAHLLEQHGYMPKGRNRWMWQGSTSGLAGVVLLPDTGRVYSHHPGDPLHSEEHSHDAFSVWCVLNHSGNFTAAVKAAARLLGMERTRAEPVDFSALMGEATSASIPTEAKQKTPHPLALFVNLDEEPRAPRWVIPGFIGHGVTVIAGAHGVGKTTTLLPLAMLAAGLHEAGNPIAPQHWRHVVYIVEEREQAERIVSGLVRYGGLGLDWATVRERLHIVEARRLPPDYVAQVGSLYRESFTREAAGVQVLPLVVIDTMAATLELDSENDNSEASAAMAALKQGFDGLPVWLVGHLSKSNLGRSEAQGMTLRGAGAFEADANQVLYLVKEGETRYLVRGKTRFEARWPELEVSSHYTDVTAKNEFGTLEPVRLRWATLAAPEQSRREMAAEAQEEARKAAAAELRQSLRDAVQIAWQTGNPLNREGLKAKVSRKRQDVTDCIENLVSERWLIEVAIPAKERVHPRRSSYLVNLTTEEHEAVLRGEPIPADKLAAPASWRKEVIPSVPEESAPDALEPCNAEA
jgi:RecA-family ATPase